MSDLKLIYTQDEIEQDHPYAKPQVEAGLKLHGGFDEQGTYISPRTLHRWPAIKAWRQNLNNRGFPLLKADTELLQNENHPNYPQQKFLIQNDFSNIFYAQITITGLVEGRGKMLTTFNAPDFQDIIEEDISGTTLAHLNKGLLRTHGWDEGGRDERGEGGHDKMWFAVRDVIARPKEKLKFGPTEGGMKPPLVDPENSIISAFHQTILNLLMNVLMIEIRAESFFAFNKQLFLDPELFPEQRAQAEHASILVDRIRQDEAAHVGYLQLLVSEFRSFTIKTKDGGKISGTEIIDPMWDTMVEYHADALHRATCDTTNSQIEGVLKKAGKLETLKEYYRLAS